MKIFFYILILLAMANLLVAQNQYTITGTMVDSLNKEKVMFATIGLLSPDSTAQMVGRSLSDAQGKEMCRDEGYLEYLRRSVEFRLEREK